MPPIVPHASGAPTPSQAKHVLTIVWFAMCGVVMVYWLIKTRLTGRMAGATSGTVLVPLFAAYGVAVVAFGWWWISRWLRRYDTATAVHALDVASRRRAVQHVTAAALLALVTLEVPAVLGLVLALVLGPRSGVLFEWFAGASLAGLMLFRMKLMPRIEACLNRLNPGVPA